MQRIIIILISLWLFGLSQIVGAADQVTIVRAKIGIQIRSGDTIRFATAQDKLLAGDHYRIFVLPEPDMAYLYVVYADPNTAVLLNDKEQVAAIGQQPLILPSPDGEWYEISGTNKAETITLICSPTALPELTPLLEGQELPIKQWQELEDLLLAKSKIDLSDPVENPWTIAGAVRELPTEITRILDEELKIFSGNAAVVQKYEFRVKK